VDKKSDCKFVDWKNDEIEKMKNDNYKKLADSIENLELKASRQKKEIQESYNSLSESLKPLNLIKAGVSSVFSGENKDDLLKAAVGLGSGFLSRKLLLGKTKSFLGKNIGSAIQWGIAGLVSNNAEKIKQRAGVLIDKYIRKNRNIPDHRPPVEKNTNFPVKS
jgi:hypothetical protein